MNRAKCFLNAAHDFLIRPAGLYLKMILGPLWRHPKIRGDYRSAVKKFDLTLSGKIASKDIDEIAASPNECTLLRPTRKDGNLSLDAQYCLVRLVKKFDPKRVFEIGTFNGNTTLQMAVNSSEDCKIFTLDLDSREKLEKLKYSLYGDEKKYVGSSELVFQGTPYEKKITRLLGDSARFDFKPYYGQMDFVFIDGSHAFDYVKSDTEAGLRMLKRGGVVVWDDYDPSWPDVVRYLDHLAREKPIFWVAGTSLCFYESRG